MKKIIQLIVLFGLLTSLTVASAEIVEYNTTSTSSGTILTDTVYLKPYLVNQDPTSAEPGSYVDLLFKVENSGTEDAENVVFEIVSEYPFSLDYAVESTKELGIIKGVQTGDSAVFFTYKLRVDKDAIDGDNEIEIKYSYDGKVAGYKTFTVTISEPKTDFELITQDSNTLAVANVGSNNAYSVIIKIPEQENFQTTGSSANIIGNLDAGDYTLASFQINKISRDNDPLIVQVSYTDTLGIRRTIQKEILYSFGTITGQATSRQSDYANKETSVIGTGLMYVVIGIVGISIIVLVIKFGKRKKK
jgi:hypothetical protein